MGLGTECACNFCAGMGLLQLGVVLVLFCFARSVAEVCTLSPSNSCSGLLQIGHPSLSLRHFEARYLCVVMQQF